MLRHREWFVATALVVGLAGCGVQPVTGGTKGLLHNGAERLGDIQVTVHRLEGGAWQPIGFGVSAVDGSFELVTPGAQGALLLTAGDYRCTLESVGWPVQIPKEYAQAETTPLNFVWAENGGSLDLEATGLVLPR